MTLDPFSRHALFFIRDSGKLDAIQDKHRFSSRCIVYPMGMVEISFNHYLATRAFESQKPRQEILWRLFLRLTAPESVGLFAVRTVERNRQRWIVITHAVRLPYLGSLTKSRRKRLAPLALVSANVVLHNSHVWPSFDFRVEPPFALA